MPAPIELAPGESERVIDSPDPGDEFNVSVAGSDVFASHRSQGIVREGRRLVAGDRVTIDNLRERPVYAKPDPGGAGPAIVEVQREGFNVTFQARATQAAARQNRPSIVAEQVSASTTGTALPAIGVPDGFSILVQNPPSNADNVRVDDGSGGGHVLKPSASVGLAVANASVVTVTALGASSQPVNLITEA